MEGYSGILMAYSWDMHGMLQGYYCKGHWGIYGISTAFNGIL